MPENKIFSELSDSVPLELTEVSSSDVLQVSVLYLQLQLTSSNCLRADEVVLCAEVGACLSLHSRSHAYLRISFDAHLSANLF